MALPEVRGVLPDARSRARPPSRRRGGPPRRSRSRRRGVPDRQRREVLRSSARQRRDDRSLDGSRLPALWKPVCTSSHGQATRPAHHRGRPARCSWGMQMWQTSTSREPACYERIWRVCTCVTGTSQTPILARQTCDSQTCLRQCSSERSSNVRPIARTRAGRQVSRLALTAWLWWPSCVDSRRVRCTATTAGIPGDKGKMS